MNTTATAKLWIEQVPSGGYRIKIIGDNGKSWYGPIRGTFEGCVLEASSLDGLFQAVGVIVQAKETFEKI